MFDPGLVTPPVQSGAVRAQADITPREMEVLGLMSEGAAEQDHRARRLDISEHPVKSHVNALLGKLGAHSRTEAVTRATRMGVIAL